MDDPIAQYFASPVVGSQGASVVQVESAKLVPLLLVLSILSGVSIAFAAFNLQQAQKSEREARMLEYYVMELDGKLMNKGIISSGESWSSQKKQRGEK